MGKKLKKADKAGIRLVVIMGSDELAKNIVLLRDLSDGSQQELPLDAETRAILQRRLPKACLPLARPSLSLVSTVLEGYSFEQITTIEKEEFWHEPQLING